MQSHLFFLFFLLLTGTRYQYRYNDWFIILIFVPFANDNPKVDVNMNVLQLFVFFVVS